MTKRIVSRWLLLCALGAGAAAVSPVYGQYMYSLVEQSGGSIWSVSALDVSLYDYADSAYVYAELSDPNGNNLDWGYDEEDSWNDYDAYAEVDLEGQVYLTGYFSVYADNYEWYLPIEDWLYLGPTTAGAYLNSGGGGPPVISNLSPPSAVYGESGYLEMDGTNFDPNGCYCVAGVLANNYSFGTVEWASDTVVTVYYSDTPPVGQNQIQIETQTGVDSNQMPFTINGDPTPSITGVSPMQPWPAGSTFNFSIYGSGFGTSPGLQFSCCIDSYSISGSSDGEIDGSVTVDPSAGGETTNVTVTSNGYNGFGFLGGAGQTSTGSAYQIRLGGASPTLTQSPSAFNMSVGETDRNITTSISPSGINFTPFFSTGLSQNPNSACQAQLSFASNSGVGTVTDQVTASDAPGGTYCSGVFNVLGYYGASVSTTPTTIYIPPQMIGIQMYSETGGGQYDGISNIPELSVATAAQNRFSQPGFVTNGVSMTNWQTLSQVAQGSTPAPGQEPELDDAVQVFTGVLGDIVGGAACYWSPQADELANIQQALASGTATFPSGTRDPQCYPVFNSQGAVVQGDTSNRQIVWKTSMPLNIRTDTKLYQGAPAFLFEAPRSPSAPAVVSVN